MGRLGMQGWPRLPPQPDQLSNCQDLWIDLGQAAVSMGGVTDC